MKLRKRIPALLLCLLMLVCLVPAGVAAADFEDVPEDAWYASSVAYCKENGLMKGVTDDVFSPDGSVNRGMIVTVLYRMAGEPAVKAEMPFSDVAADSYCANAVIWASENGIALGYEDGCFRPAESISRQQIACFIARFALAIDAPFLAGEDVGTAFSDQNMISDYALDSAEIVRKAGIILGFAGNEFRPYATTTRAQAAVIFERFHKLLTADMPGVLTVYTLDRGDVASSHSYLLMKDDAKLLSDLLAGMEKNELYPEFVPTHELVIGGVTYGFEVPADEGTVGCRFTDGDETGSLKDADGEALPQILALFAEYVGE